MGSTKAIKSIMKLSVEDDVKYTHFSDNWVHKIPCPKFMVLVEKASKSIVLVIRGTYSPADVLRDMKCDEKKFLDGFAHRGILNGAEKIMDESLEVLRVALKQYPGYSLVITGHSLGAGTAILITMGHTWAQGGELSRISPPRKILG